MCDDNSERAVVVGPFTAFEIDFAHFVARGLLICRLDEDVAVERRVQRGMLSPLRAQQRALIYFLMADWSLGARPMKIRRFALQELRFTVIYST